jgi:hypothetical protein
MNLSNLNKPKTIFLFAAIALLLLCSKDYDPFTDLTNAKVHVLSWDFAGKDSVALYTSATLKVVVAAREEVDSFAVSAEKNRFWKDTVIGGGGRGALMGGGPYFFSVSFYDTGFQTVSMRTYRSNGEMVPQDLSVRVFSPLRQIDIDTGYFGDTTQLFTPPVGDGNVFYHWMFGSSRGDSSVANRMEIVFPLFTPAHDTGKLWVSDLSGNHPTPPYTFLYTFLDTSKPVIQCVNEGLRGDTLTTGDTILAFKAYIVDPGGAKLKSCSVNNTAFDYENVTTHVYTKLFKNLPDSTKGNVPMAVTVSAIDNDEFKNTATKTFWVVYSPEGVKAPDAYLYFIDPKNDSTVTSLRNYSIVGTAENYRGDTMTLAVKVNGAQLTDTRVIFGSGSNPWSWRIPIDSLVNKVVVAAYDKNNRLLDTAQRVIIYDPNAIDTIPPMLYDISVDGRPANNLDTSADSVRLRVVAFDNGSGIKDLKINGLSITADSTGLIWYCDINALTHSLRGNKITVVATDNSGLISSTIVTIYKNTPPLIIAGPVIPEQLCIDSAYSFSMSLYDADNDPVTINKVHAPAGMSISQNGIITWKPTAADTGVDSLTLWLSDGYAANDHRTYQWRFTCIACSQPFIPVHFTTRAQDFPGVLQAGTDTLRVVLMIDSVDFLPGARFSAWFSDNGKPVMDNSASQLLVWAPEAADTGDRRLLVTVGNGARDFDTLRAEFQVVARNHYPCSLSYRFTGDTTANGELDLFSHPAAETLYFTIHDEDNPLVEKYTVSVIRRNVSTVGELNSKDFFVALRPDSTSLADTLNVTLRDLTNTSDSAQFVIRYSAGRYSLRIQLNTTAAGAGVNTNQYGFPVLVRLTGDHFDFSKALGKGEDVVFRKTNGAILPHEIERWDSAGGVAELWVKADTVYGNDSAHFIELTCGENTGISGSNPPAVFDTAGGFRGVWHLAGNTGADSDATADRFNGVRYGNPQQVAGVIGPAQRFNGVNDYIDMGNVLNPGNSSFTVSAWIKRASLSNIVTILCKTNGGNPGATIGPNNYGWGFIISEINYLRIYVATGGMNWGDQGSYNMASTIQITDLTAWHHLAAVVDRSNNQRCRLYIDGVDVSGITQGTLSTVGVINNTLPARIGIEADGNYPFTGSLDEIRISFAARSADWLRLCYMNQKAQDQLVIFR